jgi:CelD/BcsL family acetyltransferase involved in cellulose biosynthesis
VQVEVIDAVKELSDFTSEWLAAAEQMRCITPFQLPYWQLCWWRHFGSGELHTLVLREGGSIAGILPAFLHPWNGRRQVTLIGSGISDYLDPPVLPQFGNAVTCALASHLETWADWEICDWQDLSSSTPLAEMSSARGLRVSVASDVPCAVLSLPVSLHEFWAARGKELRRNVIRYRKKAEAKFSVNFEVSCDSRPDLLTILIALHEARWHSRGEAGMIAANRSGGFLREVTGELAKQGLLRWFVLRFDTRVTAIILALVYRGAVSFYLNGFDPEFARFSPGQILLAECLRHSLQQGWRKWDMLRGNENYKTEWGAELIPKSRLCIKRR